jgi:hypothetical protein
LCSILMLCTFSRGSLLQAEKHKLGQEPEYQTSYKATVEQNHSNGATAPSQKSFSALFARLRRGSSLSLLQCMQLNTTIVTTGTSRTCQTSGRTSSVWTYTHSCAPASGRTQKGSCRHRAQMTHSSAPSLQPVFPLSRCPPS